MATRNRMRGQQANQPFDEEESFLGGVLKKRTRKPKANTRGASGNLAAAGSAKARKAVEQERKTKQFEEDTRGLGAANMRLNRAEKNRRVKSNDGKSDRPSEASMRDSRKQRLALLKADTEAANKPPKKKTPPKVKMKVKPPKVDPKVTPKPVPRVYARAPGVGSRIKTALLGKDQKFGGDRGLIDFLPGKSRKKKSTGSTAKPATSTSRAKVTGKDKKDGSVRRNVGKGETLRANVTKEQLDRLGLKGKSGLTTYLNFMDKNNRRPTKSDNIGGLTLNKNMGGMAMKPKGMRRGGRVMSEPAMPTPPSRRRRGTPTPALNPNLTAADKKLRAALRGKATPSASLSLGDIVRKGGKIPTKTPTPNVDGATRRRGKTPNTPPMPKLPGGMKGGGMASKMSAKGGSMKKKGMSKGGAMKKKGMAMGGAMKKKGMSKGGAAKKFPDLTGDGKVTQADILKGRGVTKKKGGGMAKKGYAKGGMAKKGYAKGGPVRSKMSAKGGKRGGASRKPRGVGVAKRGYGKAMR